MSLNISRFVCNPANCFRFSYLWAKVSYITCWSVAGNTGTEVPGYMAIVLERGLEDGGGI